MKKGELIKQYVVEGSIGTGSFGKVYKIHDRKDVKKIYALKEINIQGHRSQEYLETAIKREIENMKKVENENSVKLFNNFEYDDCTYLVLELCDNNLRDELWSCIRTNKRSFNELEVYMIMSQLNNCFRKMNEGEEKIIHRDLKLENILVKYDKNIPIIGFIVKLSDFGLSRKMNSNDLAQSNVGTNMTKAPEIFFNDKYTHKVDLWSIGINMYQLLYKDTLPFQIRDLKGLLRELKKFKSLKLPPEERKLISDECFDLLNQLLVTDPEKRITIPEIKKHPFYLKGKDLFEQEFSITQVIKNPKEDKPENIIEIEKPNEKEENIINNILNEDINNYIKENNKEENNLKMDNNKEEIKNIKDENNNKIIEINIDNIKVGENKVNEDNKEEKDKEKKENKENIEDKEKIGDIKEDIVEVKEKKEDKETIEKIEVKDKVEVKEKVEIKEKVENKEKEEDKEKIENIEKIEVKEKEKEKEESTENIEVKEKIEVKDKVEDKEKIEPKEKVEDIEKIDVKEEEDKEKKDDREKVEIKEKEEEIKEKKVEDKEYKEEEKKKELKEDKIKEIKEGKIIKNENRKHKGKKEESLNLKKEEKKQQKKENSNSIKKQIEIRNNNKNNLITEQEKIYLPLKTEYIDTHYRLDTNENNKEEKEEKHVAPVSKKNSNLTKDDNINKMEIEQKIPKRIRNRYKISIKDANNKKEKENTSSHVNTNNVGINKSKENEKIKENNREKIIIDKNKEKEKEIKLSQQNKRRNENSNITNITYNQENKKTITPRKKVNISKQIKSHRLSNLTNNNQNISLNKKVNTLKYLEQKQTLLDNAISSKESSKIRSTFRNSYINASQQIKGIINSMQNYKKINIDKKEKKENNSHNNHRPFLSNNINKQNIEIKDYKTLKEIKPYNRRVKKIDEYEDKWQRLNTEIIQVKNKNYLDNRKQTINYNNNTIDNARNSIGYNISDIKKKVFLNKTNNNRRKYDLNIYLNERREKRKNDIKRIKSTNFSNNNTMTINTTYNNNNSLLRTNLGQKNSEGRRFLNKLQILPNNKVTDISGINNYSNRRHNYESELYNNIVKTEPSTEYMNKIRENNNSKNIQFSRLNRVSFPKKSNYNNNPASYLNYLQSIRREPNYNITKNNNLNKNINNNDILKNGIINKDRRYFIPRNNDTLSSTKKNPFVTIRNTVINFNMIDTGLILPSFNKKSQDKRKYNMIGPYNTQNQINPTKKYSRETINNYNSKNYNNSINRFSSINNNNNSFKPLFKNKTINSNHTNNHSLSINRNNTLINREILYSGNGRLKTQTQENKISAISSFNKLVNKMKNKQLLSKISNSVEKNHMKFKSMKLNDLLYRNKQKSEKKNLELTGISNTINNSSKFKSINATPNYTLPSLIIKKRKGYLMPPHGKTLKLINPLQQTTFTENYNRPSYIKNLGIKI